MPTDEEFLKALVGEDELGVVVRAHLYIEYELGRFLCAALPIPNELGRLEYSVRVRLALACGLRADLKGPLNALGALRNRFSHRPGYVLTEKDLNDLYATFGAFGRKACEETYSNLRELREQRGHSLDSKSLNQRSSKYRLAIFVVNLWAGIKGGTKKIGQTTAPQSN